MSSIYDASWSTHQNVLVEPNGQFHKFALTLRPVLVPGPLKLILRLLLKFSDIKIGCSIRQQLASLVQAPQNIYLGGTLGIIDILWGSFEDENT